MRGPGACLAIDYGVRRCGLAHSDPNRVLSTGLPTFERRPGRSLHAHVRELLSSGDYSLVVLGYPENEGEEGLRRTAPSSGDRLGDEIRSLAGWIERETGVPVALWDETLTSVEAEKRLRMARRSQRRDKAAIDRLAAEILLQEFLDAGCPVPEPRLPGPRSEGTGSPDDGASAPSGDRASTGSDSSTPAPHPGADGPSDPAGPNNPAGPHDPAGPNNPAGPNDRGYPNDPTGMAV